MINFHNDVFISKRICKKFNGQCESASCTQLEMMIEDFKEIVTIAASPLSGEIGSLPYIAMAAVEYSSCFFAQHYPFLSLSRHCPKYTGSWSFASMSSTSTVLILYYALPHLPHTPKTSYGAKNVESNNISSGDLHYLQVQLIREKKYFHRIFNITRSLIILFLWTLYLNSCYNCI